MRTILNPENLTAIRAATIATTFAIAIAPLGACNVENRTSGADASWDVEEQIGGEHVQLAEGKDGCVNALIAMGKSRTDAEKACDDASPAETPVAAAQSSGGGSAAHSHSGGGSAHLWYIIGRNSATVTAYSGHPSSGLHQVGRTFNIASRPYIAPSSVSRISTASAHTPIYGATSRGGFAGAKGGVGGMGG